MSSSSFFIWIIWKIIYFHSHSLLLLRMNTQMNHIMLMSIHFLLNNKSFQHCLVFCLNKNCCPLEHWVHNALWGNHKRKKLLSKQQRTYLKVWNKVFNTHIRFYVFEILLAINQTYFHIHSNIKLLYDKH